MNLQAYKAQLRRRQMWIGIAMLVAVTLEVLSSGVLGIDVYAERVPDFARGFQGGVAFALLLGLLALFLAAGHVMKNDAKLEKLFIAEQDERNRYIRNRIGGVGINVMLVLLAVAAIIAGFFNETVFFTLFGTLACISLLKSGLKLYFRATT